MSEETVTQPVVVTPTEKKALRGASKQVQAAALVRKLGLERAMHAVATARKYEQARANDSITSFSFDEVTLLILLTKVHVSADDLAAVVKVKVNEVLG